jgi:hypothetical protein
MYAKIILPLFLYACEIWPPTLREECILHVLKNKLFRKISELERAGVSGHFRILYNEELHCLSVT